MTTKATTANDTSRGTNSPDQPCNPCKSTGRIFPDGPQNSGLAHAACNGTGRRPRKPSAG